MAAIFTCDKEKQTLLVKAHTSLVKRIAYHLLGHLPYSIQLDDLIQAGMLGLLEALSHYDASRGASFETYAGIRIRGHILDEVRRNDWVPRSVYRCSRKLSKAVKIVENRLGREATDKEIATELDLTLDEYHDLQKHAISNQFCEFDSIDIKEDFLQSEAQSAFIEPHNKAMNEDTLHKIAKIIDGLPKKEQIVLSLYYEQDLNLKEIGSILEISESRVSQIHSQATLHIKSRLEHSFVRADFFS